MLAVKFNGPIVVDEKDLCALLSLAGCSATVEPYLNGHTAEAAPVVRRGRKPKAAAPAEPAAETGTPSVEPPAAPVKRRGRKSNAQKAAEAAASGEAPAEPPKVKAAADAQQKNAETLAGAIDANDLLDRFSKLIEKDFAVAKNVLDELGVERFSDLEAKDYPAFDAALSASGV